MSSKTKSKAGWSVTLLLLLFLPIFVDTWYNHYEKALKAVEKKQWGSVINYIRAALKYKKDPKINSRTVGIRFLDYLPFYYLGLANFRSGNFKEAQSALKKSQICGVVKKRTGLYSTMEKMLEECSEELQVESRNAILIKQAIAAGDNSNKQGNFPAAKREYIKARDLIEKTGEQVVRLAEVNRKIRGADQAEKSKKVLRETAQPKLRLRGSEKAQMPPPMAAVATLVQEGKRLYLAGKFLEAKKKFSAALQFKTNHRAAQQWLENIDLALDVQKMNAGIREYFKGGILNSEKIFRNAIKIFESREESKMRRPLITAYQFLAIVLIEKHYLGYSPGNWLIEARHYIEKIFAIDPNFHLEAKYFSPKVVNEFSR